MLRRRAGALSLVAVAAVAVAVAAVAGVPALRESTATAVTLVLVEAAGAVLTSAWPGRTLVLLAPVAVGGLVLLALALRELVAWRDLLPGGPRWPPRAWPWSGSR